MTSSRVVYSLAAMFTAATSGLLYFLSTVYSNRVDSSYCLVSAGFMLLLAVACVISAISDEQTEETSAPPIAGENAKSDTPPTTQKAEKIMNEIERAALERLISHAKRDSGQSRRVADFLLAWWNAGQCGGFDLTNLWSVDDAIAGDMKTVFGLIARENQYPDFMGFEEDFRAIVKQWRPELSD